MSISLAERASHRCPRSPTYDSDSLILATTCQESDHVTRAARSRQPQRWDVAGGKRISRRYPIHSKVSGAGA